MRLPGVQLQFSALWSLCDFTEENGATRVFLGSHKKPTFNSYGIGGLMFVGLESSTPGCQIVDIRDPYMPVSVQADRSGGGLGESGREQSCDESSRQRQTDL